MPKKVKLKLISPGVLEKPKKIKLDNFLKKEVVWEIADDRIENFRIEGKDPNAVYYPFERLPTSTPVVTESLRLVENAEKGEWDYKIHWKEKNNPTVYTLDPKIAVNPFPFAPLLFCIAAVVCVVGFTVYRKANIRTKKSVQS